MSLGTTVASLVENVMASLSNAVQAQEVDLANLSTASPYSRLEQEKALELEAMEPLLTPCYHHHQNHYILKISHKHKIFGIKHEYMQRKSTNSHGQSLNVE